MISCCTWIVFLLGLSTFTYMCAQCLCITIQQNAYIHIIIKDNFYYLLHYNLRNFIDLTFNNMFTKNILPYICIFATIVRIIFFFLLTIGFIHILCGYYTTKFKLKLGLVYYYSYDLENLFIKWNLNRERKENIFFLPFVRAIIVTVGW